MPRLPPLLAVESNLAVAAGLAYGPYAGLALLDRLAVAPTACPPSTGPTCTALEQVRSPAERRYL